MSPWILPFPSHLAQTVGGTLVYELFEVDVIGMCVNFILQVRELDVVGRMYWPQLTAFLPSPKPKLKALFPIPPATHPEK